MSEILGDNKSLDKFGDYEITVSEDTILHDVALHIKNLENEEESVTLVMSESEARRILKDFQEVVTNESRRSDDSDGC